MSHPNKTTLKNPMNGVANPHDKAFRAAMAYKQVAVEFFTQHLPQPILQAIDLDSLTLCSET